MPSKNAIQPNRLFYDLIFRIFKNKPDNDPPFLVAQDIRSDRSTLRPSPQLRIASEIQDNIKILSFKCCRPTITCKAAYFTKI